MMDAQNRNLRTRDSESALTTLQAGRAVAALAVVCQHAALGTRDFVALPPAAIETLLNYGYLGVDFFFVLSGFIIYFTNVKRERNQKSAAKFLLTRMIRIFTPYLPISVVLILGYSLLPQLSDGDRDWGLLTSMTLVPTSLPPALSVAWTLQHELLFYLMFSVAFFSGNLVIGCLIWTGAITVGVALGTGDDLPQRILLNPINLEFFFGIFSAILVIRGPQWIIPYLVGATVSFLLFYGLGALRSQSVLFGLSIAFLIVPMVQLERMGKLPVARWLVFLGNASYAIYLLHNPIISITSRIASNVPGLDGWLMALLFSIAVSVAAGCFFHLWIERPGLAWVRHKLLPREVPLRDTRPNGF